jgi:hypothetical protein
MNENSVPESLQDAIDNFNAEVATDEQIKKYTDYLDKLTTEFSHIEPFAKVRPCNDPNRSKDDFCRYANTCYQNKRMVGYCEGANCKLYLIDCRP